MNDSYLVEKTKTFKNGLNKIALFKLLYESTNESINQEIKMSLNQKEHYEI